MHSYPYMYTYITYIHIIHILHTFFIHYQSYIIYHIHLICCSLMLITYSIHISITMHFVYAYAYIYSHIYILHILYVRCLSYSLLCIHNINVLPFILLFNNIFISCISRMLHIHMPFNLCISFICCFILQ